MLSLFGGNSAEWDTVAAPTLCIYCSYCTAKIIGCRECSHMVTRVLNVQVTHLLGVLGFGGFCYLLGASKQTAALNCLVERGTSRAACWFLL